MRTRTNSDEMGQTDICILDGRSGVLAPRQRMMAAATSLVASWAGVCRALTVHMLLPDGGLQAANLSNSSIEEHPLILPHHVNSIHHRVASLGTEEGVDFLWKPFLPWLLPTVSRCLVIDLDVVILRNPCRLLETVARNMSRQGAAIGWVQDIAGHKLYASHVVQPNGGVVVMDLAKLRASGRYLRTLSRLNESFGKLGDQSLYASISDQLPNLFHKMPCGYNRQLNTHVAVWHHRFRCPTCDILHFNGKRVKWMAEQLHGSGRATCSEIRQLASTSTGMSRHVLGYTIGDSCCGLLELFSDKAKQPRGASTVR